MHFIFEEGGEIKGATAIGTVDPAADAWQAQTQFGKRIKLKAKEVWLKWQGGDLGHLIDRANVLAQELDMDFLWECAPDTEFAFEDIAKEYFGDKIGQEHFIALAIALQNAPIYFRRKGRGHFVRAPEEQLKAALLSVERKKQEALLQEALKEQILAGKLPEPIAQQAQQLLFAPDKNHYLYKALAAASVQKGVGIAQLLLELGAIHSALEIHQGKFIREHFPKGLAFPKELSSANDWENLTKDLPIAQVQAFSIDDATTTEIDDAFSVTLLANGNYQIGVHIAAPCLAISPGDAIDTIASHRMSTAYFPGGKMTMLPEQVIEVFSLGAGQARPAISLYVQVSPLGEIVSQAGHTTVIERVPIEENLRLHTIEDILTESFFEQASLDQSPSVPFAQELNILWLAAKQLFLKRQEVRVASGQRAEKLGNLDPNALARDFNFSLLDAHLQNVPIEEVLRQPVDDANWQVQISARRRGSVVDTIVAEWMIFSNQTWGTDLVKNDLPAIFRAQQGWGAQRTRMQTTPCRHEGLGVENYAWCTSPLRRYADLVNQWQLVALVKNGMMAKLVAPFVAKDTKIMGLCAEFDARYTSYNAYQQIVERYWCLRWVMHQGLPYRTQVRVLKEGMVRLEDIPLRLLVPELASANRGVSVEIEILSTDLLNLNASVRVLQLFNPDEDHNPSEDTELEEEMHMSLPKIDLEEFSTTIAPIAPIAPIEPITGDQEMLHEVKKQEVKTQEVKKQLEPD